VTNLEDAEARIREAVLAFPPRTRRALLRVTTAPQEQRAEAIGRLYREPHGREAAELLIDIRRGSADRADPGGHAEGAASTPGLAKLNIGSLNDIGRVRVNARLAPPLLPSLTRRMLHRWCAVAPQRPWRPGEAST
jgi:hypothetical protein